MGEFKTVDAAVKALGAEQALSDLNAGFKNRQYRKERNGKVQAMQEVIRANPELKKRIEEEVKRKLA